MKQRIWRVEEGQWSEPESWKQSRKALELSTFMFLLSVANCSQWFSDSPHHHPQDPRNLGRKALNKADGKSGMTEPGKPSCLNTFIFEILSIRFLDCDRIDWDVPVCVCIPLDLMFVPLGHEWLSRSWSFWSVLDIFQHSPQKMHKIRTCCACDKFQPKCLVSNTKHWLCPSGFGDHALRKKDECPRLRRLEFSFNIVCMFYMLSILSHAWSCCKIWSYMYSRAMPWNAMYMIV